MNNMYYTKVWAKYLPVIRIVLKRSLVAEQILNLNAPDFEKSGMKRRSGYKFMLRFRDGKIDNVIIDLPVASSLATELLQDPVIKALFANNEFQISLNPKFQLGVKHIPHPEKVEEEQVIEETV